MSVSITELVVIFLVALLLFGPDQLPVLARNVGKLTGQLKRTSDSLRREFYNSVYPPGQEVGKAIANEMDSLRALKVQVLAPPSGSLGTPSKQTGNEAGSLQAPEPQETSVSGHRDSVNEG